MDTAPLVKDQIDDGRKLVEQLVRDSFDVTIAFWVRFLLDEDGPWFYIVSKTVDEKGLRGAYLAIHDSIHRIPPPWGPWISVSDIGELKLVGLTDPLARDVMAFRDRYAGRNRFKGTNIGNRLIDELYIYPPTTTLGAEPTGSLSINIGTAAQPEYIDLEKVPLVTIIRDSAGHAKVELFGGGKPRRILEGQDADRFIAEFDSMKKQKE